MHLRPGRLLPWLPTYAAVDRDGPVPTLTTCSVNGRGCTLTTGS